MADAIPAQPDRQLHPATAALLRYFDHAHLPPHLQVVAAPFAELAHYAAETLALDGAELTAGLRKVLEGKDCVVRAALDVPPEALQQRAAGGVPHLPVVEQMAHDRVAQQLHVQVRIPDGLSPAQLAQNVAREVEIALQQRSGTAR